MERTEAGKANRSGHGPRALAALLPKVAAPALRRRGFSAVEIVTNWTEIVGPALARETAPERLSFPQGARSGGTLHVRASGPIALELQHLAPVVIERINICFGYAAVARIAMIQAPVPVRSGAARGRASPAPPLDTGRLRKIESSTSGIGPEPLRHALRQLGKAVETAWNRPK
jgi:hypothetical protein